MEKHDHEWSSKLISQQFGAISGASIGELWEYTCLGCGEKQTIFEPSG